MREVRDVRGDLDAVSRELTSLKSVLKILSKNAKNLMRRGFLKPLNRKIHGILTNYNSVLGQI